MKLTVLPFVARTAMAVAETGAPELPDSNHLISNSDDADHDAPRLICEHAGLARGLSIETARILSDWPGLQIIGPFQSPGEAITPDQNVLHKALQQEPESHDPLGLSPDNPFYVAEPPIINNAETHEREAFLQGRLMAEPDGWRLTFRIADPFDDEEIATADFTGGRDTLAELLLRALNDLAGRVLPPLSNVIPRLATLDSDALTAYCTALDAVVQLEEAKLPLEKRAHLETALANLERAFESDSGMKYAKILLEAICQLYWHRDILPQSQLMGVLGALVHQGEATPSLMRYYGVLKLENGDPSGAAGHLRRALRAGDNRELCAFYLARAAEMREDWIAASGWSKVLLKVEPHNPAYLALAGKASHKLEKVGEAQRYWDRALEENDELWQVRCGLAVIDLEAHEPADALERLEPAVALDPPPWPVMKLCTIAAHQAERPDEAAAFLADAAERCRFHGEEMLEAAHLALEIGRPERAQEFAEEIFQLQPDSEQGDSAARLIAAIDEEDFEERLKLAAAAIASSRSREVIDSLQTLAAAHPFVWQTKYLLASAQWESGDLAEAEATLEEALVHRPSAAELHYRLSSLLLERRRLDDSEKAARRGIACGPEREAQGFGHLAMALGYQQRWKEAREAAREAGNDARASAIRVLVEWMRQQHLRGEEAPLPKHGRISMTKKEGKKSTGNKASANNEWIPRYFPLTASLTNAVKLFFRARFNWLFGRRD